jgi:hypothetical protein
MVPSGLQAKPCLADIITTYLLPERRLCFATPSASASLSCLVAWPNLPAEALHGDIAQVRTRFRSGCFHQTCVAR